MNTPCGPSQPQWWRNGPNRKLLVGPNMPKWPRQVKCRKQTRHSNGDVTPGRANMTARSKWMEVNWAKEIAFRKAALGKNHVP